MPVDTACTLIKNILGEPTKQFGLYLADHVVYWQWENRVKILEKAQKKLDARKLSSHLLPKDFVVPFIRECGDTSSGELQEWWSELLASAIEDEARCHVGFVNTLKQLSASDVLFMDTLLRYGPFDKKERPELIAEKCGLTVEQARISYYNFDSLGFFTPTGKRLKGYAVEFLKACCGDVELVEKYKEREEAISRAMVLD